MALVKDYREDILALCERRLGYALVNTEIVITVASDDEPSFIVMVLFVEEPPEANYVEFLVELASDNCLLIGEDITAQEAKS